MRAMRSERDIEPNNVLSFLLDPATNRLEDDIRREEGVANMQSIFFLSPLPQEIGRREEDFWRTGIGLRGSLKYYSGVSSWWHAVWRDATRRWRRRRLRLCKIIAS